jgi:hypothetical protein
MDIKETDLYGIIDKKVGPLELHQAGRAYSGLINDNTLWNYVLRSESIPRAYGLKTEIYSTSMSPAQFASLPLGTTILNLDTLLGTTTSKVSDAVSCHVKTTLVDIEKYGTKDIIAEGLKDTPEYSGIILSTLKVLLALGSVVLPLEEGIIGPVISGIGAIETRLLELTPQLDSIVGLSQVPLGNVPNYQVATNGDYINIMSGLLFDTFLNRNKSNEDKFGFRYMDTCTQNTNLFYLSTLSPNLTKRLKYAEGFGVGKSKETNTSAWNYSNLGDPLSGTTSKLFGSSSFGAMKAQYQIMYGAADYAESSLHSRLPEVVLGGDGIYKNHLQYVGSYNISSSMIGTNNTRYTVPQFNLVAINGRPIALFEGVDPHSGNWNTRIELLNNII